tara:strand:+ start:518 stop:1150 length:633 start_codon:yes stop_codon:yes gene_type:complete
MPAKSRNQNEPFVWSDLRKHVSANRKVRQNEVKNYEKDFLTRYKKHQKAKPKKKASKALELGDLGRLNFRKHTITKRREYLVKRKDYEQKYVLRYMKTLDGKSKRSSGKKLDHDLISGRLNLREQIEKKQKELQAERQDYEKNYLSRYKEPKSKIKKSKSLKESGDELGRLNFRKHVVTKREKLLAERNDYEKKYLARYKKQQKTKRAKK